MYDFRLTDSFKRRLNYLRVSITDRCNLNCCYCEPRKRISLLSHDQILRYEEILRLVRIFVQMGVDKVRVTGGEPLVRKGVYEFIKRLAGMHGLKDVSLTTNAICLAKNLERIKDSGIKRINISLDTLNREKFAKITGYDSFDTVWNGITKAYEAGFSPIKLNTVVLKGVNDDELADLAALSFTYPFHIRFIEYMPMGSCSRTVERSLLAPEIIKRIRSLGELVPVRRDACDGPARRFKFVGAKGEIGVISAMSEHFCHECNRLRLTAAGSLRTCLLSGHSVDLKGPMRAGSSDEELSAIIMEAVRHKQAEHELNLDSCRRVCDQMSSIGG